MSIFEKIYNRINWQNKPSTETPINSVNLNKMDSAIDEIDDRVVELSENITTNENNISDINMNIQNISSTISKKADTANPTLTGTPKAPTATSGTNTTQIATTAFVQTAVANLVDSAPETLNTLGELAKAIEEHQDVTDALDAAISNKVDKVSGKGLSTNDYTTAEKNKLSGIATGANKTVVDTALSSTSTNPVQNNVITEELGKKTGIHSFIGQLTFSNGMAQWEMGVHSGITHVTNVISVCGWGSNYTMSFSVADANASNFSIYIFASNGSGISNSVLSFQCFYTID